MADRDMQAQILQLKKQIETLEGAFLAMRRHYEDLLNNLDEDNFAANYKVQQDNKFTQIQVDANGIKTTVASLNETVDGNTQKITEFKQTADGITSTVTALGSSVNGLSEQVKTNSASVATVQQTANSVSSEVAILYNTPVALYGKEPDENSATNVLYAYYVEDDNGDVINDNKKYRFYCYYKYNTVFKKWEQTDKKSIISRFEQTADGFKLSGDVKISGDQIVDGVATLRDNVNVGDANTMGSPRGITFNGVAKISTIKGADLYPNEFAGLSISAPLLKLGTLVDFSGATVTGLYAVFE